MQREASSRSSSRISGVWRKQKEAGSSPETERVVTSMISRKCCVHGISIITLNNPFKHSDTVIFGALQLEVSKPV